MESMHHHQEFYKKVFSYSCSWWKLSLTQRIRIKTWKIDTKNSCGTNLWNEVFNPPIWSLQSSILSLKVFLGVCMTDGGGGCRMILVESNPSLFFSFFHFKNRVFSIQTRQTDVTGWVEFLCSKSTRPGDHFRPLSGLIILSSWYPAG